MNACMQSILKRIQIYADVVPVTERVCACRSVCLFHDICDRIFLFSLHSLLPLHEYIFCTEHLPLFSTLIGQTRFLLFPFSFGLVCECLCMCAFSALSLSLRVRVYAYCLELCSALVSRVLSLCVCVRTHQVRGDVSMAMRQCIHCSRTVHHFSVWYFPLAVVAVACVCECVRVYLLETHEIHPRTSIKGGTSAL